MRTNREIVESIIEELNWSWEYNNKEHKKQRVIMNSTSGIEELEDLNRRATEDCDYHYKKAIEATNKITALKEAIKLMI